MENARICTIKSVGNQHWGSLCVWAGVTSHLYSLRVPFVAKILHQGKKIYTGAKSDSLPNPMESLLWNTKKYM